MEVIILQVEAIILLMEVGFLLTKGEVSMYVGGYTVI